MDELKMAPRHPRTLIPCDECLKALAFLEKQGVTPAIKLCTHQMTVAVMYAGFLCVREAYEENQAFKAAMELAQGSVETAGKVLLASISALPDDVREPLFEALKRLQDAKPS